MKTRTLSILFVLSGCTSLIYEVVFHKLLTYVFGGSTLATTTVLVAFMGGLALGGRFIGTRADGVRHPVALYGWMEIAIGAYVLCVPVLLSLCTALYAYLGVSSDVHALRHVALRFVLSCFVLVLPTMLMGGTLPLLATAVLRTRATAKQDLSRLYALNTAGAAIGTLIANYILLPNLGIYGTLILGACVNGFIGWRAWRLDAAVVPGEKPKPDDVEPVAEKTLETAGETAFRLAVPAAFAVGLVSFTLEVVWTHLLATVVGMSVYAFGLMLATFLCGLALGAALAARLRRVSNGGFRSVVWLQLSLAAVVIGTLPLWDRLPYVFVKVGEHAPGFLLMELTRAGVCVAMLLPPSLLVGMTFPVLLGTATFERSGIGRRVGLLYAVNTLGCIVGAVITGFVLLERFGSRDSLVLCAFASLLIGVAHAALAPTQRMRSLSIAVAVAAAVVVIQTRLPPWDWKSLAAGMNVSFNRGALIYDVLWTKEDAQGGITTITRERRGTTLRTNGKFQADDRTELVAQQGFALLPILLVRNYGSILNIGYGSGITAGVLSRFPFKRIEIAELSPVVVEAADRYYSQLNYSPNDDPRTKLVYDDGRNHLLVSKQKYDLITVEISSIWFAGAANLYNREFYELCKARMQHDAVLQQWVQLHHISRRDLLIIWNTLRSVFPYVSLWRQGTQGSLIATMTPQTVDYEHVRAMNELATTAAVRARMRVPDFFSLLGSQQLSASDMDGILKELPKFVPGFAVPYAISRDYYPYLEYSTPKGYALSDAVEQENINWLRAYQHDPLPAIAGVPDPSIQQRIEALAAAGRRDCHQLAKLAPAFANERALFAAFAECKLKPRR